MKEFPCFTVPFKVRDYECDQQGIVNNAVYLNYFEHARHEYLEHIGLNFKNLLDQGIYLIVTEINLRYKRSLKSGDSFSVTCQPALESPYRIKFVQEIINQSGEKITQAETTVAGVNQLQKIIPIDKIFDLFPPL